MTRPPTRLLLLIALVFSIAAPAAAHSRFDPFAQVSDLRFEPTAQDPVQPLRVFTDCAFADVARLDLPQPSIADELARRLAADRPGSRAQVGMFASPAKEKLASGVLALFEENNVNEARELGPKLRRTLGNVRARWYDPMTGSFLSPDPKGYVDSSNLYAIAGGDPVNRRDPTGNASDDVVFNTVRDKRIEDQRKAADAWCKAHPVECKKGQVRASGFIRAVGGALQGVAGAAGVSAPEPTVTKALGTVAIVRGIDNFLAGGLELITGNEYDTVTGRALYHALVKSGVSREKAAQITGWTEAGVDIAATLAVAPVRASMPRAVPTATQAPRTVSNALDAQRALAEITTRVNAELATNPALAQTVLSPAEYAAAQASSQIAKAQYGNVVERLVAQEIARDPALRRVIQHVGGPNNPDFVAFGQRFDITTVTMVQVTRHMRRPGYGPGLGVITYERPTSFSTF